MRSVLVLVAVLGCGGANDSAVEHAYDFGHIGWTCEELAVPAARWLERCGGPPGQLQEFVSFCCGSADDITLSGLPCETESGQGSWQEDGVARCTEAIDAFEQCDSLQLLFFVNPCRAAVSGPIE
jgi:hypothetical protein